MTEELEDTGIEPAEVEEQEEAATSEEEVEETEEAEETEDDAPAPPKAKGVQKRINELTKQREEERRERLYWQQQAMEAMKQRQPEPPKEEAQAPQSPQPPGLPPDRYDFDSTEQYQQAVNQWQSQNVEYTRHLIREEQKQAQEANTKQSAEAKQREAQQQTVKKLAEVAEKGTKKYSDFKEVAYVPEIAASAVARCENADEIAYYWGKNPDKAQEFLNLASSDPSLALYELGKLDVSLKKQPQVSKAPDPIKPVGANQGAVTEPDPEKDPDAWLAWERARVKKLGRRY